MMICQFFTDDQFREAIRWILKMKSISIYRCIMLSAPLDVYVSVVARGVPYIHVEETVKFYFILKSWALSNWWMRNKIM